MNYDNDGELPSPVFAKAVGSLVLERIENESGSTDISKKNRFAVMEDPSPGEIPIIPDKDGLFCFVSQVAHKISMIRIGREMDNRSKRTK